jgi:hypothetical protein
VLFEKDYDFMNFLLKCVLDWINTTDLPMGLSLKGRKSKDTRKWSVKRKALLLIG